MASVNRYAPNATALGDMVEKYETYRNPQITHLEGIGRIGVSKVPTAAVYVNKSTTLDNIAPNFFENLEMGIPRTIITRDGNRVYGKTRTSQPLSGDKLAEIMKTTMRASAFDTSALAFLGATDELDLNNHAKTAHHGVREFHNDILELRGPEFRLFFGLEYDRRTRDLRFVEALIELETKLGTSVAIALRDHTTKELVFDVPIKKSELHLLDGMKVGGKPLQRIAPVTHGMVLNIFFEKCISPTGCVTTPIAGVPETPLRQGQTKVALAVGPLALHASPLYSMQKLQQAPRLFATLGFRGLRWAESNWEAYATDGSLSACGIALIPFNGPTPYWLLSARMNMPIKFVEAYEDLFLMPLTGLKDQKMWEAVFNVAPMVLGGLHNEHDALYKELYQEANAAGVGQKLEQAVQVGKLHIDCAALFSTNLSFLSGQSDDYRDCFDLSVKSMNTEYPIDTIVKSLPRAVKTPKNLAYVAHLDGMLVDHQARAYLRRRGASTGADFSSLIDVIAFLGLDGRVQANPTRGTANIAIVALRSDRTHKYNLSFLPYNYATSFQDLCRVNM